MITHDTPDSSNIARIEYDADTGTMFIDFRSGKRYRYSDVSTDLWNQFIDAPSAGQFFNQRVKSAYKGVEV